MMCNLIKCIIRNMFYYLTKLRQSKRQPTVFIQKKTPNRSTAQHTNNKILKFSIPYLATTANLLLKTQDFEQVYSSCPGLVPLPYLLSLFHYQMRLHQATFVHANVKRTHVHATAQSLSLREEGELVCNWVTPVG